jgi:hypothetical protein
MRAQQCVDQLAEALPQQAAPFVPGLLAAHALVGQRGQHRLDARILRAARAVQHHALAGAQREQGAFGETAEFDPWVARSDQRRGVHGQFDEAGTQRRIYLQRAQR